MELTVADIKNMVSDHDLNAKGTEIVVARTAAENLSSADVRNFANGCRPVKKKRASYQITTSFGHSRRTTHVPNVL